MRLRDLVVFVVDDGNEPMIAQKIKTICGAHEGVCLIQRPENGGKGAAVIDGIRVAARQGFSHAVQVDADGQHDISRIDNLLDMARVDPAAFVTATPVFDDSVPRGRLVGRWITHVWVSINTLSPRIIDTMCGFRVYPLAPTLDIVDEVSVSQRMGFDTEIVVRLCWRGVKVLTLPVRVIYPAGNHSNFSFGENAGVSATHARLFFGMLRRAPGLIWRRMRGQRTNSGHWASLGERGSAAGLWFLAAVYRLFGRRVCLAIMSPVILFFFVTGREQRRASMDYLQRLWRAGALDRKPGYFMSFRHFMSFGAAALDKFAAWTGNIPVEDIAGVYPTAFDLVRESGKGAFMLTAHLGNPEVIRAIGSLKRRARVNVLVHTAHALRFNKLIERYSSDSTLRMIQVTEVGPDTAIILQNAVANGEVVVIVGDRIPVRGQTRISWATFFGAPAPFAQGPHILASILKCPVYLLFCVREGARHRVYFEPFAERIELPRKNREAAIQASVQHYAERLEHYVRLAPLQWFNFYDYWHPHGLDAPRGDARKGSESEMAS
jgi:predicted LPLAT superfamily acyltransferase